MAQFDGAAAGSEAAQAARSGLPTSLEHSQNVVTDEEGGALRVFELAKCGCDCWYCPDCCERKGYNLRAELIAVLRTFTGLMMLTLTVDPTLFPSPRDAYLYVRDQRAISRLMRELCRRGHLHSPRYFYVVEFQQETEQAHFHVLVDATHIPKSAIDEAWSRLRPKWAGPVAANRPAFGMTRFSRPRFDGGPAHAGRYATKYLVKSPERGWPSWVMTMGNGARVPRYQTSRGFWNRPAKLSKATGKKRTSDPRTYAQRVSECGTFSNLFESLETVDESTGEVQRGVRWLARLGLPESAIEPIAGALGCKGRRLTLMATHIGACIKALQAAAGHPISAVSGAGVERGHR